MTCGHRAWHEVAGRNVQCQNPTPHDHGAHFERLPSAQDPRWPQRWSYLTWSNEAPAPREETR